MFLSLLESITSESLTAFSQEILGFQNNYHHREWYGLLDGHCYQDKETGDILTTPVGEYRYNKWLMIEAPRSHSKSTSFTVNYSLWEMCRNKNVRIVIVSNSQSQSMSFLREITSQLERNDNIKKVYGNLVPQMPEKWTASEIIIDRDNPKLKDPTVSATSIGGTVLARRADIIICDDILNQDNSRTLDQRMKTADWFWKVLLPVLEPDGRLIVVGTAWNVEDLYEKLLTNDMFDVRKRYKAVIDESKQKVLWQSRWNYETLMKLKSAMGSVAFNQAYQNEALASEDAVFKKEWIDKCIAKGVYRTFIDSLDYAKWDLGGMRVAIGVDLAISQKRKSDFTTFVVVGELKNGDKIILYASREKLSPKQTREKIKSLNSRFSPDVVVVENNAYQDSIRQDIVDETSIPIVGYATGGEKYDLDIGINSLAVEIENDKWIFPYSSTDPQAQSIIDILVSGMLAYPSGHTEDLLMALWFANGGLRSLNKNTNSVSQGRASDVLGR